MGFTETLRLVVNADLNGATRNVERFGGEAEREFSKSEKSLDKWGNRLTSVGTGMMTFGGAALFGLGKMAMASEEAHLSVVKLENTISNMPKLAGENSAQFIELADSIQDVTAADADAIVEGQALLGTFNLTAKEIKGITPLVVDYARKFGLDIPQAATMVGKALDGSVGALKRNGVSIDEVMFKTDRYGAVQKALTDQVGGFAEAEGKTFAGSLQRLKNELGDLVEGVGSGAVDAFTDLAGVADVLTDRFDSLSPETQSLIGKVATFGAVGLIAAGGLSTLVGQAIKMRENFSLLKDGLSSVKGALSSTAGGLLAVEAAAAVALFAIHEMGKEAHDNKIKDLAENFLATGEAADIMRDAVDGDKFAMGDAADVLDTLIDSNLEAAERFVDAAEAAGMERDQVDAARDAIEKKRSADIQGAADQEVNTAAVQEGAEAMGDQADATDDAKTALQEWADAQRAAFDPLFAFNDALLENEDAQAKVIEAELKLIAAQKGLTDAQRKYGESSDEAAEASFDLMEAQRDLEDAHRDAISSVVDYESAFADLKAGVESGTVKLSDAKTTVDRWASSGRISAASAAFFKGEIDKLSGALKQVPGRTTATVMANTVQAREAIRGVDQALRAIPRLTRAQIEVAVTKKGGIPIPGGGKFMHSGGIVDGPAGADVPITAQAGEGLFTKGQMAAIGAGLAGRGQSPAGGGQVVHNHYYQIAGAMVWERDVIRLVADEFQRGGFRGMLG